MPSNIDLVLFTHKSEHISRFYNISIHLSAITNPDSIMSDSISVATKTTQLTSASRRSIAKSTTSNKSRRNNKPKTHWTVIVRDAFAALFDMIGDWVYFYAILFRDEMKDGPTEAYLFEIQIDYKLIIATVLSFCILSTIFSLWTIVTSLGRNCGRNSMCCNCTIPRLCLAAILLEDVPQFVITTWIDYTFTGGLTPSGMLNICSSLTALVNRMTTRYEEVENENKYDEEMGGTVYEKMKDGVMVVY